MKNFIVNYVFLLLVISQIDPYNRYTLFLGLPIFIILMLRHTKIPSIGLKKIVYLFLILFIGVVSGLLNLEEHNLYYSLRDVMYFIQAPIFIFMGILLYEEVKDIKKLAQIIIISSTIISMYKLFTLVINPSLIFHLGLETRYTYDLSNSSALIAFTLLYYFSYYKIQLFNKKLIYIVYTIAILSIFLSFSRTLYILFLIVVFLKYINSSKIVFKAYFASVLLVFFLIFGGSLFEKTNTNYNQSTIMDKMSHSLEEAVIREYKTLIDINNNWRGFEAYMGLKKYYKGNEYELFFGQGFGSVVKTPSWIFGKQKQGLHIIPMFHNGYITILLKTGLFGIFFYFLFMFILLKHGYDLLQSKSKSKSEIKYIKTTGALLIAMSFILFFYTLVIHGIFRTTVPMLLLIPLGVLLQYSAQNNKAVQI